MRDGEIPNVLDAGTSSRGYDRTTFRSPKGVLHKEIASFLACVIQRKSHYETQLEDSRVFSSRVRAVNATCRPDLNTIYNRYFAPGKRRMLIQSLLHEFDELLKRAKPIDPHKVLHPT